MDSENSSKLKSINRFMRIANGQVKRNGFRNGPQLLYNEAEETAGELAVFGYEKAGALRPRLFIYLSISAFWRGFRKPGG